MTIVRLHTCRKKIISITCGVEVNEAYLPCFVDLNLPSALRIKLHG